jgi:PilZ domain
MADKPPQRPIQKERSRAVRVSHQDYPRVPGRVVFTAGVIEGAGIIMDISATGAQIYRPSKMLPKGAVADLFFLQPDTQRKLHAVGQVVRLTDDGFGVQFLRVERELEQLVLSAAGNAKQEPIPEE